MCLEYITQPNSIILAVTAGNTVYYTATAYAAGTGIVTFGEDADEEEADIAIRVLV